MGMNPQSGEILWRHEYATDYECNIATPVAVDGQVFISSGENHGSALLKLKPQGDRFAVEEVWQSHGPQSVLRFQVTAKVATSRNGATISFDTLVDSNGRIKLQR